jgi:phage tail protein X
MESTRALADTDPLLPEAIEVGLEDLSDEGIETTLPDRQGAGTLRLPQQRNNIQILLKT